MCVLTDKAGCFSVMPGFFDGNDSAEDSADLPAGADGFAVARLADGLRAGRRPALVRHRIVHAAMTLTGSVRITAGIGGQWRTLTDLAPLHQPQPLSALDAVTHAAVPAAAATYAVPVGWRNRYGVRRYGFDCLSRASCARDAAETVESTIGGDADRHLAPERGRQLAVALDGRSVDMAFAPLGGW